MSFQPFNFNIIFYQTLIFSSLLFSSLQMSQIERHPLAPFLPANARLLMLGSFPPSRRRWCMDFFYPNFINDMWRIFGIVFFGDKEHFVSKEAKVFKREEIIAFLQQKGIALYDTATAVIRTNNTASDKGLQVVEPTDLDALLRGIPQCRAVIVTGQKAADLFISHYGISMPKIGEAVPFTLDARSLQLYRLPSSSRAYPMKVERKAEIYAKAFEEIGLIGRI